MPDNATLRVVPVLGCSRHRKVWLNFLATETQQCLQWMAGNRRAFELLFRDFKTFVEAAKKGRLTSGCPPTSDRFHDFSLSLSASLFSLRRPNGGINSRDSSGYTALHYAALNGHRWGERRVAFGIWLGSNLKLDWAVTLALILIAVWEVGRVWTLAVKAVSALAACF